MYEGAPSLTAAVISSTCAVVNSAVTLTFTPLSDSSRTSAAIDSPSVVVTGIFTYTFSPHDEIRLRLAAHFLRVVGEYLE